MPQFTAALEDIHFNLHDCLNITQHYTNLGFEDAADEALVNAVIEEAAKFASEVISPLNYSGDQQQCQFEAGVVSTPQGFKQAYQQYCQAGWASLAFDSNYGGQGLPHSLALVVSELNSSANTAWSMYPGLTHGAINALFHHGSERLKQQYLPKLISGEWTGTMCLTEAHCGSDLGLLKSRAVEQPDGSYTITGSKVFISAGEHDMSDNIIHLVLARINGAPEGSGGISLFLVPKIIPPAEDQEITHNPVTNNQVSCGSIEHKMGIKGSATCVINFEDSKGFLIGPANKGLNCMFTMMNSARLATGVQGYAIAELARQASLAYAKERLQMRSLSGVKYADKPADPIIVHPDVKRMLLTQKALVEGCRGLAYYTATLVDSVESGDEKESLNEQRLSLLTPICKALMSELGFECANHAVQVYGGHGYICESEVEQLVRDARITQIYEGTNGIQALDLLARKVLRDKGVALTSWLQQIKSDSMLVSSDLTPLAEELAKQCDQLLHLTQQIGVKAAQDMDEIGAAAFDFLMFTGYISLAYILLRQANIVPSTGHSDDFKLAKQQTTKFYFARILPRVKTHKALILSGNDSLQNCEFDIRN